MVKEHKGKWYVFTNIQAESWCEVNDNGDIIEGRDNRLSIRNAVAVFNSRDEAYEKALEVDREQGPWEEGTEYGVQFNRLCKDDAEVFLEE